MRTPAEVFPPATFILEELAARGWERGDDPTNDFQVWLDDVIEGKTKIDFIHAELLGREFGTSPDLWLNLQRRWDEWQKEGKH